MGSYLSHIIPRICSQSLCVYFSWFKCIFSFKVKYQKRFIFLKTLPGSSLDDENIYSLLIPPPVRMCLPCISIDIASYSDRLLFWTTSEFIDEDLWDRFWCGAAGGRQSLSSRIRPYKFWYVYDDGWVAEATLVLILFFFIFRVDPPPLKPGGHPGKPWPEAAYCSSLLDHSSWDFNQKAAEILIALKAGVERIFVDHVILYLNS